MRWKIRVIDLGSKKSRQIKKLKEYIDGISAKIYFFCNELEIESEAKHLTPVKRLEKAGKFIVKLQREIIEFKRNGYKKQK